MPLKSLDPRTGGACVQLLAKKFFSYVVAYVQLIIWVVGFFTLVFHPSSISTVVENSDTTSMVISGFLSLFCIAFSVLLILGLHKDRRLYIKIYCIYVAVYLLLMILAVVINIFVQPKKIGFRGFFSMLISFFINLLFFFVVRCYYVMTYCNGSNQMATNQPKV